MSKKTPEDHHDEPGEIDQEAIKRLMYRLYDAIDDGDERFGEIFEALIQVYGFYASTIDCDVCRQRAVADLCAAGPNMLRIADRIVAERGKRREAERPVGMGVH